MISDDLTPLLKPSTETAVRFRQGRVTAWDAATGDNTVQVGGAELVNVPSLTSEAASIAPGDIVMMLAQGNTWLLLGKVTAPGDPESMPAWFSDIEALAPLQELAGVTEGTTISGATLSTSESATARRIVMEQDPENRIIFYSGEAGEVIPAYLSVDSDEFQLVGGILDTLANPTGSLYLTSSRDSGEIATALLMARHGNAELSTDDAWLSVGIADPDTPGLDTPAVRISAPALTLNGADVMVAGSNPQPVAVADATTMSALALTTTYAAGPTVCGTAFTAPPTGKVYITVGGRIRNETNNNTLYLGFEVRSGATVGSGTVSTAADNGRAIAVGGNATGLTYLFAGGTRRQLITGLTPGSSYNVRTMHACQSTTATGTIFNRDILIEPVL